MPRAVWLTDIHLNFLDAAGVRAFAEAVRRERPDQVWVGGDIAEGDSVAAALEQFAALLDCPVAFVLGNHDFYRRSFVSVRADIVVLTARSPRLTWLTETGVVPLSPTTALIGHDSWADGGYGDFMRSTVRMNDYVLIEEFKGLEKPARLAQMQSLGRVAAEHFRMHLTAALRQFEGVYILTHVPPIREACKFHGHVTSDNWLPHLANRQAGEVLRAVMAEFPHRRATVLCGHTHHASTERVGENLWVHTGAAEYRKPAVQRVLEI